LSYARLTLDISLDLPFRASRVFAVRVALPHSAVAAVDEKLVFRPTRDVACSETRFRLRLARRPCAPVSLDLDAPALVGGNNVNVTFHGGLGTRPRQRLIRGRYQRRRPELR